MRLFSLALTLSDYVPPKDGFVFVHLYCYKYANRLNSYRLSFL